MRYSIPRKSRRVPLETPINLKLEELTQPVATTTGNVSLGGMFAAVESPPAAGSLVAFEFELGGVLIEGTGEVVWVHGGDEEGSPRRGIGVSFRYLSPGSRERIFRLVQRYAQDGRLPAELEPPPSRGGGGGGEPVPVMPRSQEEEPASAGVPVEAASASGLPAAPEHAVTQTTGGGIAAASSDDPPLSDALWPESAGPELESGNTAFSAPALSETEPPAPALPVEEVRATEDPEAGDGGRDLSAMPLPAGDTFAAPRPDDLDRDPGAEPPAESDVGPAVAEPRSERLPFSFAPPPAEPAAPRVPFPDVPPQVGGTPRESLDLPPWLESEQGGADDASADEPSAAAAQRRTAGAAWEGERPSLAGYRSVPPRGVAYSRRPRRRGLAVAVGVVVALLLLGYLLRGPLTRALGLGEPVPVTEGSEEGAAAAGDPTALEPGTGAANRSGEDGLGSAPDPGDPGATGVGGPGRDAGAGDGSSAELPGAEAGGAVGEAGAEGDRAPTGPAAGEAPRPLTRVESITWERVAEGTLVLITGDGAVRADRLHSVRLSGPNPRLVVYLRGVDEPFRPAVLDAGTAELRSVRTGLHDRGQGSELNIVLDLAAGVEAPRVEARGQGVEILLARP